MKNSIKFAVAAVALCVFANASAGVIIQSSTKFNAKKVFVQYRHGETGVLHTMKIKEKKLAKWCAKRGGCRVLPAWTPGNGPGTATTPGDQGSIITSVIETGGNTVSATVPEQEVVAVPEPVTLALMGAGLLGLGLGARGRRAARGRA